MILELLFLLFFHPPRQVRKPAPAKVTVETPKDTTKVPYGPEPMCGGSKGDAWCY